MIILLILFYTQIKKKKIPIQITFIFRKKYLMEIWVPYMESFIRYT